MYTYITLFAPAVTRYLFEGSFGTGMLTKVKRVSWPMNELLLWFEDEPLPEGFCIWFIVLVWIVYTFIPEEISKNSMSEEEEQA